VEGDGKRHIVQSDELLSAFLELEKTLLWSCVRRFFYSSVEKLLHHL